jgi:hypothetical protein
MKKISIVLFLIFSLTRASQAQVHFLTGSLQAKQVSSSVSSFAGGTVIVRYDAAAKLMQWWGNFRNLTATNSGVHIHGAALPGSTAPILFATATAGGTNGAFTGTAVLTSGQEGDLLGGKFYVDVHSTGTYSAGEIRAQLTTTTLGQTEFLISTLTGAQQVPPTNSIATGMVNILVDKTARMVYVTGNYSGLTSAATNAHIHKGASGVSGTMITPLVYTTTSTGTLDTARAITSAEVDSILSGKTYVDIHTFTSAAGEIRGQVSLTTLPVKLTYFNGYKDRNQVALIWESAQEIDVKSYEVEQQNIETGEWVKKATVTATGGNAARKYRLDDLPTLGRKDYVLYRLKMIDADGKFVYSPIIRINFGLSKAGLTIMPNPVINNKLRFTITGITSEQKAEISVIDLGGRTMLKTSVSSLLNNNIDISTLSSGVYKLIIRMNNGDVLQENFSK